MKAVVATGSKQVDFVADRPEPTLKDGEVLVRVAASPIQPSDFLNISGAFPQTKFPIIAGRDYSGIVVKPESSSWYGKKVYGTSGTQLSILRDGVQAEFVAIPEDALAEAPNNLDLLQASMIGTPWTTAFMTLHRARAKQGEVVLVTGAGGNVGSAVAMLAKSRLFGCKVLTAGRGDKYDVDVTTDPELSTAKVKTDGRGPDVVIDTTGDLKLAYAALRVTNKGGRLSIITTGSSRGSTTTDVSVDFLELYRLERCIIGCNSLGHSLQETAQWLSKIKTAFEAGDLTAPTTDGPKITKIDLEGVADAFREIGNGSRQTFLIEVG